MSVYFETECYTNILPILSGNIITVLCSHQSERLGHPLWQTGFKNWKWRFQHLRRRVWPRKRANRARFSCSPTSHFGRSIKRRLPFLQDIILKKCRHTPSSSKSVSDAMYSKNRPHFWTNRLYTAGNLFSIICSESGNTVKKSNDAPGEKKNGPRYLSPKDRKYSEKGERNSVRLWVWNTWKHVKKQSFG